MSKVNFVEFMNQQDEEEWGNASDEQFGFLSKHIGRVWLEMSRVFFKATWTVSYRYSGYRFEQKRDDHRKCQVRAVNFLNGT